MRKKSIRGVQNTPHETRMDLDSSMAMFSRFARSLGGFGGLSAPLFVYMEGNVGAGKSTVLAELKFALEAKGKRVCLFLEQSERWTHQGLLEEVYDGSRSGKRAFEVLGPLRDFVDRRRFLNAHEREYDVVLFERHPWTALRVFGAASDPATREMYASVDAAFPFASPPDMTIYLRVSPEECLRRVTERGRPEEKNVTSAFLREKHEAHEREMRRRREIGLDVREISGENRGAKLVVEAALECF